MDVFSREDINYARSIGVSPEDLESQWLMIQKGFPAIILDRAAIVNDGILRLSEEEIHHYNKVFEAAKDAYTIMKFTPASGAASRMFAPMRKLKENTSSEEAISLITNLTSFPFYKDILTKLEKEKRAIKDLIQDKVALADFCLSKEGMDFDRLPKGLVTFYREGGKAYNAFDLHCFEANEICEGRIHFTVSDEYLSEIEKGLANDKSTFSVQHPSTHYLSYYQGKPLRNENGKLILRPSGHGALLKNLEEVDADIVLIKNIDNIQAPAFNEVSINVKKTLTGLAIERKKEIDTFLLQLKHDPEADLSEIKNWIIQYIDPHFDFIEKDDLFNFLNRPIRIAGMVLNEGKIGGGPFWVKNSYGSSLQIVEGAQINTQDSNQREIVQSSTHFNPVELVCCLRDFEGNKFDLSKFVDNETGFLSQKNIMGKAVTIMERPGLWNGSMANWISLFIEIPLESFTPVKSIFDLLPKTVLNS